MVYWNDDEFIEAVKSSKTISDVLRIFGIPVNQGYYNKVFHRDVKRLGLSTSHFVKTITPPTAWPLENVLVKDSQYKGGSSGLRERLIKETILENKCSECGISEWNGKKLSLHLDHINGHNTDNRIENLRILCPNCHSQTPTYCGAKKRRETHAYKFVCKACGGKKKTTQSTMCHDCSARANAKSKINWPEYYELLSMVESFGFEAVGRKLGVSGAAVKKHIKRSLDLQGPLVGVEPT